ncbi:bifunctional metallophosphatase/5'-nucleotidase [Flavobacterium silvaticum]|uniref:Bifunctional metallophosphatase/5'-nucleotidase n=1 Tax=Flavobacterium silvaticum TaxID=1852020 RepID=A0A972FNU7_9FLAO|nr:metallophosphatase [Flavobacterium silvaticum]NMH29133.1 bifunctional metallophosphatase/5'-nucleotidase [Flavobacterium silvaticum]
MKRRDFLQRSIAGSAALTLGGLSLESFTEAPKQLTILHTNDVHSYIDPFPMDHPKFPGKGGVARRAAIIEQIRAEQPNVLLFDAGDIFQGTPYFNYYGGELEMKLMSMMKYDLGTLGNHDFDNGVEGFYKQMPHADFGFVSANYDFSKTILKDLIPPYHIFKRHGIKIGVFGLGVAFEGLVDPKNYGQTVYIDPLGVAKEMVSELKTNQKCDFIICLSHLGYDYINEPAKISDIKLAAQTSGIDLIIGGHTHTFLEKPSIVKNLEGHDVVINQTGCYGVNLGRIDVFFEKGKKSVHGRSIIV